MAKLTMHSEGLAVSAPCADGHIGDLVKISGDETVTIASPGDDIFGFLRFKDPTLDDWWTVEVFSYRTELIVPFTEAIAAGEYVKYGDLTDGVQSFSKWLDGTDAEKLKIGVCWVGGDATTEGHILI
jgi:hypothetical protein